MAGRILRLEELSSPFIQSLDKNKTVFFVAISPIEGHGPHLPLGVDYFDAIYFADSIAKTTIERKPEFDAIICPPIPLGTQVYRQAGSLRISNITLYNIVKGFGESLASYGFRYVFLLSGHGSPKDIVAIESACVKVSKKHKIQMHNLSGALAVRFLMGEFVEKISSRLKSPISDDDKKLLKKDIHGGWWETSMMMMLKPDLVNDVYKNLPDTTQDQSKSEPKPGYYGSPSKASREFAEISISVLTNEGAAIIQACLEGKSVNDKTISPLYRILPLKPFFVRNLIVSAILLILILAFLAITPR